MINQDFNPKLLNELSVNPHFKNEIKNIVLDVLRPFKERQI